MLHASGLIDVSLANRCQCLQIRPAHSLALVYSLPLIIYRILFITSE